MSQTTEPDVSVVMSVFNGAGALAPTLDSVLNQQGVEFELIVVNDGSSDATGEILQSYASRDARLQVIEQANTGLTQALMRGCAAARAPCIARQDCGDVSLPGRLAEQLAMMRRHREAVMTSCGTRFVGPGQEFLYEIAQQEHELQAGLATCDAHRVHGPSHHGSTMFRRTAYQTVGGYRGAFNVAQDLDLWMRLSEVGACLAQPQVLYMASLAKGSISGSRRPEQVRASRIIAACAAARRAGSNDAALLAQWSAAQSLGVSRSLWRSKSLEDARFHYFIGSVLRRRQPRQARAYFVQALRDCPWHLRSWVGLLRSSLAQGQDQATGTTQ